MNKFPLHFCLFTFLASDHRHHGFDSSARSQPIGTLVVVHRQRRGVGLHVRYGQRRGLRKYV
jgi:hypothetical protein